MCIKFDLDTSFLLAAASCDCESELYDSVLRWLCFENVVAGVPWEPRERCLVPQVNVLSSTTALATPYVPVSMCYDADVPWSSSSDVVVAFP